MKNIITIFCFFLVNSKGSGWENLLCSTLIFSEFDMASPREPGSISLVKSFNSFNVGPISSLSVLFNNIAKIAWVAQAFCTSCFAKNKSLSHEVNTFGLYPLFCIYLNKNIRPYTGSFPTSKISISIISSTWTPFTPIFFINSENTPGSLSIVHHSDIFK